MSQEGYQNSNSLGLHGVVSNDHVPHEAAMVDAVADVDWGAVASLKAQLFKVQETVHNQWSVNIRKKTQGSPKSGAFNLAEKLNRKRCKNGRTRFRRRCLCAFHDLLSILELASCLKIPRKSCLGNFREGSIGTTKTPGLGVELTASVAT